MAFSCRVSINFLRNFATYWGAPVFTNIAEPYLNIGASSPPNLETYKFPSDLRLISNQALTDGLNHCQQLFEGLGKSDSMKILPSGTLRPFIVALNNDVVLLPNDFAEVLIGMKAIRENMVHLGTHLYLGQTYTEMHKYNEEISKEIYRGIFFIAQAEY